CLRARRAIIDNEPHFSSFHRQLSVPIFDGDRLVLVAGCGEKAGEYDSADIRQLTLLMDGMWKTLQYRRLLEEHKEIEVLRQADRLKDEILSIVSHELRTPLNAIVGFASLLEDGAAGPMSERQCEFLGKILHHSEKMESLIEELLDLAQMKAGRFRVFPAQTPYLPLIEDVLQGLRPLLDGKRLVLHPQIEVERVPSLDRGRIHQVLTNLLSNAIKFTPPEGTIRVRAFVQESQLVTEVSDTGIGIAPEDLPKLFLPFHQLDMSMTREVGGTGLGLSISRGILEAHGGRLEAESPGPGKGATFRFRLPFDGASGADDGAAC
ncbi:MAG: ATP-binding protein, partial [Bacteroidota bacterium]